MEKHKITIPQFVLNALVILVIAAYGFIFNSMLDKISKNEAKIEAVNPVLLQIQTDLATIKTNLEWLMNDKINHKN